MLTANRVSQLFDSAREWESLIRQQLVNNGQEQPVVLVNEESVLIELNLPGYTASHVDVEVEKNQLRVSASTTEVATSEKSQWRRRERTNEPGEFQFQFPFRLDAEKASVSMDKGVLRIEIGKPDDERPRKLKVK